MNLIKRFHELREIMRRIGLPLRLAVFLVALGLLAAAFELLGVAMLLPVLELLQAGGSVDSATLKGRHWEIMRDISNYVGVPISLGLLLGIAFVFILLRQFVLFGNALTQSLAKRRIEDQFRRRTFAGFLRAVTTIQERSRIGGIVGTLTADLKRALLSLFTIIDSATRLPQLLLYVTGLFLLSAPMTLCAFGLMVLTAFFARGYIAEIRQTGHAISEANAELTGFMVERLKHARLIRLSGTERAEAAAFAGKSHHLAERYMRQSLVGMLMSLLPEPIVVGFATLMLFIGSQIFNLSLESLTVFVLILIRLRPIVRGLINDHNNIMGKWPSLRKLDNQLQVLLVAREPQGGDKIFDRLQKGIKYEHVTFAYSNSESPALRDVTVTLPAHRMSALVGPSGAGKSTLIDLLPRLRDPIAGQICFDDVQITEFTTESLRAGIAFVPQQPQIFNISAAEHIRYGREQATDAEVREAARLAGALPFIEALPDGFDTLLGDGGVLLSGGQRQRLDIARALVRRAQVLVLDEPTSALDADAEDAFRDALRTLRANTSLTIIVIAHRLSTIFDAELIVVLKGGRVEAVGGHEELLSVGGWYAQAFKKQSRKRPLAELDAI